MTRLLLVEDDLSLGQTLFERLNKEGYETFWAKNLEEARDYFAQEKMQMVILDVGLPDGSGFDFAKEVRQSSPVPFLFVTAQTSAEDRLLGYEIGAEEYIPKPFHLKELLLRVSHVLENHAPEDVLRVNDRVVDFKAMSVTGPEHQTQALSVREAQILSYLVKHAPRVISREELLNHFWGEGQYPSNRTVDNIIVRLRQLLGDGAAQLIGSVRGVGYQWNANKQ